jgi:REP element-mobilizing transposase RayT
LVEVTCRTIQGRFLLRPSRLLNSIIVGVLGRAQRLYRVEVHAFVFLSNHYHLLVSVEDALQLARFMNYLNSNLAREAGRLHRWREKFWGRRYQAIVVSNEDAAQIGRLRYILSHGCKEGLVARPNEWPGAHCVDAMLADAPLTGRWFDRTREYSARIRGEDAHRLRFSTREDVHLTPLPCWRHLSKGTYRRRVAALLRDIESESASRHSREGTLPLGQEALLAQDPHSRPPKIKRAVAPAFHAASEAVRNELRVAYSWFHSAYREASRSLRRGARHQSSQRAAFPQAFPLCPGVHNWLQARSQTTTRLFTGESVGTSTNPPA